SGERQVDQSSTVHACGGDQKASGAAASGRRAGGRAVKSRANLDVWPFAPASLSAPLNTGLNATWSKFVPGPASDRAVSFHRYVPPPDRSSWVIDSRPAADPGAGFGPGDRTPTGGTTTGAFTVPVPASTTASPSDP